MMSEQMTCKCGHCHYQSGLLTPKWTYHKRPDGMVTVFGVDFCQDCGDRLNSDGTVTQMVAAPDATSRVTMHCSRCEEYAGQLAEALETVAAQARVEERYVALLLEENYSECPYRQTDDGCIRGYTTDEIKRHCRWREDRDGKAATCWRLWARAEEAAK